MTALLLKRPKTMPLPVCLFLLILGLASVVKPARASGPSSANVKAAYLFNFARMTTWPGKVFKSPAAPVEIGILGQDPFGAVIDGFLKGKTIGARTVVAKRLKSVAEAKTVQVIYVSPSFAAQAGAVIGGVGALPVLTVGDFPGFCAKGGHLNFYAEGPAVRFEANPGALKKAGVSLNAKLLGLARIVK